MDLRKIDDSKESFLEILSTIYLWVSIISIIVGIIAGLVLNSFIYVVIGIISFIAFYFFHSILLTLAENHCMLRNMIDEQLKKREDEIEAIQNNQCKEEKENDEKLQKLIDSYK